MYKFTAWSIPVGFLQILEYQVDGYISRNSRKERLITAELRRVGKWQKGGQVKLPGVQSL